MFKSFLTIKSAKKPLSLFFMGYPVLILGDPIALILEKAVTVFTFLKVKQTDRFNKNEK